MTRRRHDPIQGQNRGKQVVDGGLLALDRPGGDWKLLLIRIVRIRLGPSSDEWHVRSPFIVRAFFATQRRSTCNRMLVAKRRIRAVVAKEQDQRVLRDYKRIQMFEDVTQRLVHAFD